MDFYRLIWTSVFFSMGLSWVVTRGYGVRDSECGFEYVTCPCGESGSLIDIPIERCSYFIYHHSICRACERYNRDIICSQFRHCLQCNSHRYGNCQSCERGRYGNQCQNECRCENAGFCDMNGQCQCPPNYLGLYCEIEELALCGAPSHPQRGHVDYSNITEGGVATYSCPRRYILIGHQSRTCLRTGHWSGFTPSCEFQCDIPEVGENSHIIVSPVWVTLSRPGLQYDIELIREANFDCEEGYLLQGVPKLTCLPNGYWNSNIPRCVRACAEPTGIENGHYETEGLTEGSVTRFVCNQGWELIGDSEIVCFNGQWVIGFPRCVRIIVCHSPVDIEDGSHQIDDSSYSVGSSVSYRCDSGFTLRGSRNRTCLTDSQWSGQMPWCEEDNLIALPEDACPEPEVPAHGYISNRRYLPILAEGIRVHIQCDEGYVLMGNSERECLESGEWSGTVPTCMQVVTCQDPGVPRNGKREDILSRSRSGRVPRFPSSIAPRDSTVNIDRMRLPTGRLLVNTQLIYECDSPYYRLVGSRQRRCRHTGAWSGRQPTCIADCGQSSSLRLPMIFNGTVALAGQSPWQVGLAHRDNTGDGWYVVCGASLIDESWIVTAGHCVTRTRERTKLRPDQIKIYLGKHYRNDANDDEHVQVYNITEIILHNDYSPSTFDSDIALVRLNGMATFTERVRPICLPSQDISDFHLQAGTTGCVTGWGRTDEGHDSDILKMTTVQTITNEQCEINYARSGDPQTITSNMFCAGVEDGSTDTCGGDSGGPMVFPYGQGQMKWYLEGIVSWGSPNGCGIEMQYGGYTKVINFIDWIYSHI